MSAGRNYRQEYDRYHKRGLQKKRRAQRNGARRLMIKKGSASKGDGKDVGHKQRNKRGNLSNATKNLVMQSKSKNRANNQ